MHRAAIPTLRILALGASLLLAGCASSLRSDADVGIASVEDTRFVCGFKAPYCSIVVTVEAKSGSQGECLAAVDMDEVKVKLREFQGGPKKEKPVHFVLMRRDMKEQAAFEFVGTGIEWMNPSKSPPEPLIPQPNLTGKLDHVTVVANGTISMWIARGKLKDSAYRPAVRRVGSPTVCEAKDPKIANDG